MYARSTILRTRPELINDGIEEVRDRIAPALQEMAGFAGYSMLVDRESGRCVVTTAWHDQDALAESRERVLEMRRRTAAMLGASDPEVREWEIAALHREHPVADGSCARVTWMRMPTDRVDRLLETFRGTVLPRMQELSGFCSASLLVDRSDGLAAGAAVYESPEALAASREAAMRIRSDGASSVGAEIMEVAEFDVALAHLRVPEHV